MPGYETTDVTAWRALPFQVEVWNAEGTLLYRRTLNERFHPLLESLLEVEVGADPLQWIQQAQKMYQRVQAQVRM